MESKAYLLHQRVIECRINTTLRRYKRKTKEQLKDILSMKERNLQSGSYAYIELFQYSILKKMTNEG